MRTSRNSTYLAWPCMVDFPGQENPHARPPRMKHLQDELFYIRSVSHQALLPSLLRFFLIDGSLDRRELELPESGIEHERKVPYLRQGGYSKI